MFLNWKQCSDHIYVLLEYRTSNLASELDKNHFNCFLSSA